MMNTTHIAEDLDMAVTCTEGEERLRIAVEGRFDFHVYREFRRAYADNDAPYRHYEVDLARVEYLDSSALGMLLLLQEYAEARRSRVSLCGPSPAVRRLLEIAHFHNRFEIH